MHPNPKLSYLGNWKYGDPNTGVVSFYSPISLGPDKLNGIVLGGWSYSGWENTVLRPISIAILEQGDDGALILNTGKYISDPTTNGQGSVIVSDFNLDGIDDIFLAAHNESPLISTASTVYLSKPNYTFEKITLADSIEAHSASLGLLNGIPTIVTSGYGLTDPFYQFNASTNNFTVSTWGNTFIGSVYGSSALAGSLTGDGNSQLVIGDFKTGPGYSFNPNSPTKLAIYQLEGTSLARTPAFIAPLYFDGKPEYLNKGLVSEFSGLSHNYRVWEDDFNNDGKNDLLVGVGIWSASAGWQKAKLQMFQNQGDLQFTDVTDRLGQAYDENSSFVDYSMQMLDLDGSGIKSYLMAGDPFATGARRSSYLMANDGTGNLHTALHEQFEQWAGGLPAKFIPYQLSDGTINYLVQQESGRGGLFNFPLQYNISTDFTANITVLDRNDSMLMRTWAGNDTFWDSNSNALPAKIDGGLGLDTSIYSDKVANYSIRPLSNQSFEVKHTATSSSLKVSDTLTNIERLQFTDTNLALDVGPTQNAGSVYMLYKAAFNRAPDNGGMGYWLAQKDGGADIVTSLAQGFVGSKEFTDKYGTNPSNASYVDKLYQNVLGRAGEAGGVAYWNQELDAGRMSKAAVLVQFATLAEGAANVASLIANGIPYTEFVG
jgi:hypothetical protein